MKNLIFRKNIIAKKKAGGAMIVLMLVFFVIFILAFGSGYLVFMNTSKSVDVSNGIKARYAALAGKDRALYEAMKNNYDFAGNCSSNIFQKTLTDGSSYIISCVNNSGSKSFFSTGKYKNVEISLEIDCINIEKECSESCKTGSICGGGKLLKTDTYALSVSPSGCDANGANCSNAFATADTATFQWDTTVPDTFECGTSTVDYGGQIYNTVKIGTQCWFKQNLNIGATLLVGYDQINNSVSEKYCYNSVAGNCNTYGGLYFYGEAMQYNYQDGAQGLCPSGWHIPTLAEWNVLATSVPVMCPAYQYAFSLKTSAFGDSSPNCSGMTVLPSGFVTTSYQSYYMGSSGGFWISNGQVYLLNSGQGTASIYNASTFSFLAASARCIKDSSGSGSITYKGASSITNGKTNITTVAPQTNTYLESAKYCDDLVANGYSDWYLPATNELAALRSDSAFSYFNLQSVSGDDYWVSTEQGSTTPTMAGYIKMSTGVASNIDKGSEFKVRCVRKDTSCSSKTICGSTCDYGGEEYETIQIGSQCWFKRNLNIGSMINSSVTQSNNSTIEKYCYINNSSNCATYGGLYQWNEAMQYSTSDGAQGLCPSGWHLPKDSDWTNLTNYLSANSQHWCSATSVYLAKSLSSVSGWNASGSSCMPGNLPANNNSTGFSAIPGGYFYGSGWGNLGVENYLWTSTTDSANAWWRSIGNSNQRVSRSSVAKNYALTIRCLKD